jgi:AcrR family transcriptional regulator/DNA-binding MarR family transcriptional regulator
MGAVAGVARVRVRKGAPGPRGGGAYVSVLQRTRLLDAAVGLVVELGARGLTVRRVTARAGISSKTFYDLFADREECLLAAFDQSVDRIAGVVLPAYGAEDDWVVGVRAGLGALLGLLDGESLLGRFVFVEALACGPRVLERRARLLGDLAGVIDAHAGVEAEHVLGLLTAEGVLGAVCGVIHTRLLESSPGPLVGLLGPLMAMIVLPYRGQQAATAELARAASALVPACGDVSSDGSSGGSMARSGFSRLIPESSAPVDFRPTLRTFIVLSAIAERPGLNNREVSDRAGVSDQGQISRLLWRLEDQGLVQNTGGREQGTPKAWSLTPLGQQALHASRPHSAHAGDADAADSTGDVSPARTGAEASVGRGV